MQLPYLILNVKSRNCMWKQVVLCCQIVRFH
uniref:Uncharacterized protein n=1 Tax=Aegilops tauschii subsp. strangulata TaxID=200361 RepID=A0A453H258_AEGTS